MKPERAALGYNACQIHMAEFKHPEPEVLGSWPEVVEAFSDFPIPSIKADDAAGQMRRRRWIFRGQARADYLLQPSIE